MALGAIAIATAGAFALDREGDKPTPPVDAKEEILALVHAWEKAVIDGDVGTMDRVLAYELVGTDPEGWIWDKTKYLDHVKRRAFQVAAVDLKDIRIQVYGDAAVETGIGVGHYNQAKPPWIAARTHYRSLYKNLDQATWKLAVCRLSDDGHRTGGGSGCWQHTLGREVIVTITFADREKEKRVLAFLTGRFSHDSQLSYTARIEKEIEQGHKEVD